MGKWFKIIIQVHISTFELEISIGIEPTTVKVSEQPISSRSETTAADTIVRIFGIGHFLVSVFLPRSLSAIHFLLLRKNDDYRQLKAKQ